MSTRRGLIRPQQWAPRERLVAIRTVDLKTYRCVYCKRLMPKQLGRSALPSHELECDMRGPMLRIWDMQLRKAKRREATYRDGAWRYGPTGEIV